MSFDKFVLDFFRCDFVEFCSGISRVIVAIFGQIFVVVVAIFGLSWSMLFG